MSTTAEVVDKVRRLLVAKDYQVRLGGENGFVVPFEETDVLVDVDELEIWDDEKIHPVEIWAPVLLDVPTSPDLYHYIAAQKFRFGSFKVHFEDDEATDTAKTVSLTFSHTILGDFLDLDELQVSIGMVLVTSVGEMEDLQSRFGGNKPKDQDD